MVLNCFNLALSVEMSTSARSSNAGRGDGAAAASGLGAGRVAGVGLGRGSFAFLGPSPPALGGVPLGSATVCDDELPPGVRLAARAVRVEALRAVRGAAAASVRSHLETEQPRC